jgi:hypothetical protein
VYSVNSGLLAGISVCPLGLNHFPEFHHPAIAKLALHGELLPSFAQILFFHVI